MFDTNTVVSALLFRAGRLAWLRPSGRVIPLASKDTLEELVRVLAYPKFRLSREDADELLAEYVPHTEVLQGIARERVPVCRDPGDQKFLELAVGARADALVTGDGDILALRDDLGVPVITPAELQVRLST